MDFDTVTGVKITGQWHVIVPGSFHLLPPPSLSVEAGSRSYSMQQGPYFRFEEPPATGLTQAVVMGPFTSIEAFRFER